MLNNCVKILHCADLHLGSSFSSLENIAAQRSSELLETFDSIINICKEQEIDFLFVAGDLFDKVNVGEKQVDSVIEMFLKIPGTYIVISPGNHDPFSADSFYMLKKWPENVFIFKGEMSDIFFEEKNVRIYGAGFTGTYSKGLFEDIIGSLKFADRNSENEFDTSDTIEICVIHAELVYGSVNSLYNPITKAQIEQSGFDYIALGHVHNRTPVQRAGKTYYAYPGPPEGRGFDEQGKMGVYVGTVSKGSCELEFVETSKRCFKQLDIDIGECYSNEDIYDKCIRVIKQTDGEIRINDFYRIILQGEVSQDFIINISLIESKISELVYFARVIDSTKEKLNLEKLASGETLKGIYARKLLQEINRSKISDNNYSDKILEKAVRYGMAAFSGEVVPDEY